MPKRLGRVSNQVQVMKLAGDTMRETPGRKSVTIVIHLRRLEIEEDRITCREFLG
jgi:hypothetical protein